jgi:putative hydrolase of the HAD superfamily
VTRGVVFDLFHTLTGLESERSDLPWTADVLGIDRKRWDEVLMAGSQRRLTGEERDPYRIVSALAREIDPTIADERIRKAVDVRMQRFRDSLFRVPEENIEVVRKLRSAGLGLGLISNADAMEVAAWNECPLAGLFDAEVFSCDVGCVKPDRAIYEHCLRSLRLSAGDCLFVGDGGSNELAGARAVGMSTVFVSGVVSALWPDRVPQRLLQCDHRVQHLPEVLTLLGVTGAA